eukprot:Gregarina_sp_Poly_1__3217@NODE_1917_length_3084_cov_391_190918_g1237_i0_p1_GENE_NODE_1917_length_3084_cov_391_190918_g1237_i0NODE_1917_length_3084_cov_391_190918_g1237_i0_p1_ORF_typecomplete_len519_score50_69Glyco_hydro_18/PF00704_28/1e39DUF4849/PF16141_5/0_16DUF4849/PF16141_5/4_8e03_NODE_1917_length_3084_cov_391_190918_g1237_i013982954
MKHSAIFAATLSLTSAEPRRPFVGWYAPNRLHMDDRFFAAVDPYTLTHYFVEDRHVEWDCVLDERPQDDDLEGGPREQFQMPRLRALADEYDFKIILMLGGWGGSFHYAQCLAPEKQQKFINVLLDYMEVNDFDGVDLDVEHIGIGGVADFEDLFDPNWNPTDPNEQRAWHTKQQRDELLAKGWEYHRTNDGPNFNAFVKELRVAFDKLGEKTGKRYEITSAMSVGGQAEGCGGRIEGAPYPKVINETNADPGRFQFSNCERLNWGELCQDLDYLSIMVYDIWGAHMPWTASHHAPLDCDPTDPLMQILSPPFTDPCMPRLTVKNAIEWFMSPYEPSVPQVAANGGCDPSKLTIGFPGYGKGLCNTTGPYEPGEACSTSVHGQVANHAGASYRDIKTKGYFIGNQGGFANQTYVDSTGNERLIASYFYDADHKFFLTYDSPQLVHEKAKYAAEKGVAGYFFYDANHDFNHELDHAAWQGYYAGQGVEAPTIPTRGCTTSDAAPVFAFVSVTALAVALF